VVHRLLVLGTAPDAKFFESLVDGVILPLVRANSNASKPQAPTAARPESE
jgi:prophage antirepressor-like protein